MEEKYPAWRGTKLGGRRIVSEKKLSEAITVDEGFGQTKGGKQGLDLSALATVEGKGQMGLGAITEPEVFTDDVGAHRRLISVLASQAYHKETGGFQKKMNTFPHLDDLLVLKMIDEVPYQNSVKTF
jgi:hypothetical protein